MTIRCRVTCFSRSVARAGCGELLAAGEGLAGRRNMVEEADTDMLIDRSIASHDGGPKQRVGFGKGRASAREGEAGTDRGGMAYRPAKFVVGVAPSTWIRLPSPGYEADVCADPSLSSPCSVTGRMRKCIWITTTFCHLCRSDGGLRT